MAPAPLSLGAKLPGEPAAPFLASKTYSSSHQSSFLGPVGHIVWPTFNCRNKLNWPHGSRCKQRPAQRARVGVAKSESSFPRRWCGASHELRDRDASPALAEQGGCIWSWALAAEQCRKAGERSLSILLVVALSVAVGSSSPQSGETFEDVPQTLSGGDGKTKRIQRPKSRAAEDCTRKCVATCVRAPNSGEGPLNVRRPLVVFKEGFHSRQYCLVECSDICNLMRDGTDGP